MWSVQRQRVPLSTAALLSVGVVLSIAVLLSVGVLLSIGVLLAAGGAPHGNGAPGADRPVAEVLLAFPAGAAPAASGPVAFTPAAAGRPSPAATGWPALDAAVARIPGYAAAAPTTWRMSDRYGHLGSTLLPAEEVSISPSVPPGELDAVVRHEWSHVLQSRAYGGDVPAMVAALDAAFGGTGARGVDGVENAADCMALQLGATWTHYTDCRDPRWRAAAAVLLTGARL